MNLKKVIFFLFFTTACLLPACKQDCITLGNCNLVPDPGLCEGYFPRYYFDQEENKCKEFIWGGCDGVVPFETMEECDVCECKG